MLIATVGASNVLWFNAATFVLSAAVVMFGAPSLVANGAAEESGGYLSEFREGLRYIRVDRVLLAELITTAVVNLVVNPLFSVVMPVYAHEIFGSAVDLGLVLAGIGAGGLVGTIGFGAIGHRLPRRPTFIGAFLIATLPLVALTATPGVAVTAALLVVWGVAIGPVNPILNTISHERVPAGLRGRVYGLGTAISWGAIPLGAVLAGLLLEWTGLRPTLMVLASLFAAIALSLLLNPALRHLGPPDDDGTNNSRGAAKRSPDNVSSSQS